MDGSSLEQRLAASFGSGPNARAAARQALQQQRNEALQHTGAPSQAPTGPVQSIKDGSFAFAVARPPVPEDPLLRTPALPAAQYQPAHAPVPSHMPVSDRLPAKYRTALGAGAHGSSNTSAVPEPIPRGQGGVSQNSNFAYYLTSSPPDSPRASPARSRLGVIIGNPARPTSPSSPAVARGRGQTQQRSPPSSPRSMVTMEAVMRQSATRLSSGSLSPDSSDHLSPLIARPRPHSSPLRHPSPPAAALPPQEALQLQHQFAGRREEPTSRGAHQEVSARLYTAPTSRSRSPTAGTRASANPGDGLSASRPRSARPATQRLSGQPRPRNQSTSSQRPTSSQAAPAVTAQVQGNSGMAARNPAAVGMEGEAVLLAAHLNSQQPLPSSPSGPGAPSPSSPSPQRSTADPRHRLSPTARRRLRAGSRYREQESLRASQERAEAHFHRFRIKQHRDDQPDVRYSQPRSQGPHVVLGQHTYSFDPAHPAMAGQHYLRSQEQEGLLAEERRLAALKQRRRAAQLATPSGSRSPSPVTGPRSMTALQREVARIARARERSREQMQRMQEKGDAGLAAVSHLVQRRALDAINASEAITRRLAHSPSPAASPPRLRSASPHRPTSSPARPQPGAGLSLAELYGFTGTAGMEAGGPSPPDPYPYREPGGGQASPGQRQAWLEVQYERDNAVQTDPGAGSSSLADYLALSSGVRVAEFVPGTALAEGEMRLAMGGFDAARFEEYNRQMDLEMQQRADQRAYDSDQEREEQAAELMSHQALTAEQQATQEQERQDKQDLMALLQQTWEEQDSWMDEYRTRLGPQEGYQGQPQGRRSTQSSPGGQGQQLLGDMRSPSPSRPSHQPLSPSDEALVDGSFMPLLSPGLVAEGYVSEGPDGYVRRPQGGGGGLRPAGRQRPFTPTVPEPMAFEERAAARPKPIRTVKLEQDLAIKQQEEQAARHWRHKARPVPDAVLDQRYQQMLLEAEVRRQINRDTRLAELASMVEQPFSFQERDEQRKMMQEAIAARAKDPNRFQQHFHAKPVPTAVKIEKFKFMQMELEAKRAAARARMEEARALARQRLQQDVDHRQDNAKRQYQERLRSIDPIWNQKYDTKPPGAVPDFDMMHSKWEQRMATMRALNRRHMTVPQEFGTHTARTPAEALQRRQRILLEMQADEELLPESRWPFKSLRGRVQPQPPPAFTQPDHKVSDTRANMLRRAKTHQARRQGQFDDPEDKERKALMRARTEAEERAKVYMALKTKQAYGKPSSSSMPTVNHGLGSSGQDPGVADENAQSENEPRRSKAEQRELIKANTAVPVQHVEARHAQVEAKVRSMVEGALLQTGLSAYNAYTYQETP